MGERSVIALDIGGTNTRVALFDDPARSLAFTSLDQFLTKERYEQQFDQVTNAISKITNPISLNGSSEGILTNEVSIKTNGISHQTNDISIGVSIGARLMRDGGGVTVAPNLRDYEGRPFAHDLAERCGMPVRLAHDPVCGLLAERRFGTLRDADRCAYVTVSTGTGAAIYLGSTGEIGQALSIEFGHQILDGDTRKCLCGQVGCLETYTGGRQLTLRYGRPLEKIEDTAVWDALYDKLALGLVNLAQLTRVEVVALSGAIALRHEGFLEELRERVERRLRGMALRLELAALGEQAPLVGAALLPDLPAQAILH
ncbi:MAG TPA: ROK family protein [Ktedonobacterales bacterium]|jgi:glucokinase